MSGWLDLITRGTTRTKKTTIVVPVYGDWDSLKDCIESLKQYAPFARALFINDCGPDVELMEKNITAAIQGIKNYEYFRNPVNLGFVRSCNRAVFKLDKTSNNIMLLNSDTKVTEGFLEEMERVLNSNPLIASVSPRSNHATVFSIPFEAATDSTYPPEKSYDKFLAAAGKITDLYEAPTTHGFCMLIRRKVINKFGLFDEVYGKGYGEENDFCMRVRHQGYTHAIANHAFVFHLGSKSFTPAEREERIATNNKILLTRYPEYEELVSVYIRDVVLPEQPLFQS